MSNQLVATSNARNLPALPIREAERCGAKILAALDRLGFLYTDWHGRKCGVCFSEAGLFGDELLALTVDGERLWRYSVADLCTPKVIAQLRAVTGKHIVALRKPRLTYVVDLKSLPPTGTRLPEKVRLDLGQRPKGDLLFPIGATSDGSMWRSLPEVGHCLITGATGSGKSVWLHTALAALLTAASPDRLRIAMVDPKRSELIPWANAPHLLAPIAYDVKGANVLLAELADECDRRGDLFADAGARHIIAYNRRAVALLPFILIVIDEGLDLLLDAGPRSQLIGHLKALAMRGRAAGVFVWLATQHATAASGLPRVVAVNLTSRLVFRVADRWAADVAGCPGAECIPRNRPGRLLARLDGPPAKLQAFYLPDSEVLRLARSLTR